MSDSDSQDASSYVKATFSPDPGFALVFDGLKVTEALGRPFLIQLDLSSGKGKGNIEALLGSSVTVEMTAGDGTKSYYNGILTRIGFTGLDGGVYRYQAELRPWIWLLKRTQDCKIFQNMSAFDIIGQIFRDNGFSDISDKRQASAGSLVLEYCVQYRETAYDFVMRLMEQFGIYYYFEHADGKHTLAFADDPNSHTSLTAALPFRALQTEQRQVDDHVWEWTSDLNLRPGGRTLRDYDFTMPAQDTTSKSLSPGSHPHGSLEIYDYPGLYSVVSDGQKQADVLMQADKAQLQVFQGRSNGRGLRTGVKFTLSNHDDTSLNQEYLVTGAEATMTMAEGGSDTRGQQIDSYRVSISAIQASKPFRLPASTPKPLIRGPQTALVVGTSGEEITTDKYGRIKVQFYWDRIGTKDENSSCWIRVAQTWAGAGWGTMFIPRIGMEVVVAFLEGNPDRPLVTGVVYNATQTIPYTQPDNATRSTFKTNSSKGGGGFNELRFEDKKDSEEIFLQAQKDYNWQVLNNETGTVTKDQSITVKEGNRSITVSKGNETITVSEGNQDTTVSKGNQSTTISTGNHKLDVTAGGSKITTGQAMEVTAQTSIKLTATASIELTVGSNSIKIDPSGVTINGTMITGTASAEMKLNGGGMMELVGGIIKIN
jgi:type VI secretion system secreted protein VgrG